MDYDSQSVYRAVKAVVKEGWLEPFVVDLKNEYTRKLMKLVAEERKARRNIPKSNIRYRDPSLENCLSPSIN